MTVKILAFVVLIAGFLAGSPGVCIAGNGGGNPRGTSEQDSAPQVSAHDLFEFHSGFWINLHLFLYEQAAIATAGPRGTPHEAELATDASMAAGLSEDETKTWSAALAYYRKNMLRHDLVSDADMIALKNHLEDLEGATSLGRADLDPALISVIDDAAPIYRSHWWQLHDAANQTWIKAVMPLVDKNGATLSQQIAMAFETLWPDHPLRVDVVAYASSGGSYTTLRPARIIVSSIDGGNQNVAALEVLFHAASATLTETVSGIVIRGFAAQKKSVPPGLAEAILFFTSGFFVKQLYPGYTPYADRFELWTTEGWDRAVLVKDWQPRVEGRITLDAALAQLAGDFSTAGVAAPQQAPAPQTTPATPAR
ncbi:MAG: hypothetical protein ABSE45_09710 [Candidatus Acidiferrales bacterium]|jgi:hypothetical protein